LANEQFLQTLLNDKNEIAHAVYFNEKPQKVMQAYLGAGQIIFCTEDSTSMVSEAVVSQKPVMTLRNRTKQINPGHQAVIERFSGQHYIQRLKIDELADFSEADVAHKRIDTEKNYDLIVRVINSG
jgi:mitochondrial fission protein ELM1